MNIAIREDYDKNILKIQNCVVEPFDPYRVERNPLLVGHGSFHKWQGHWIDPMPRSPFDHSNWPFYEKKEEPTLKLKEESETGVIINVPGVSPSLLEVRFENGVISVNQKARPKQKSSDPITVSKSLAHLQANSRKVLAILLFLALTGQKVLPKKHTLQFMMYMLVINAK